MGAVLGRIVNDYQGLVEVCRQRAEELEISRLEIDQLSGLAVGHAGKILGKGETKRMGPVSLGPMLEVLGLRMLIIEDAAATQRTLARRSPVNAMQQRFNNKCNGKAPVVMAIENVTAFKIAPKTASESRAHLRVIQGKKKGRGYGSRQYG
jgi:hypothetical protein